MGADGGIAWIEIKGGTNEYNRFLYLLEPFGDILFYQDKKSMECWHPTEFDIVPQNSFISTYGTNQNNDPVKIIEDAILAGLDIRDDQSRLTFHEIEEDILTRGYWIQDGTLDFLVKNINLKHKNHPVLDMVVNSWAKSLKKLINHYDRHETWT